MGLMDKSLDARRVFNATNDRMLKAIIAAAEAGSTDILQEIDFVMTVGAYEHLVETGLYSSVKRKRKDRRTDDRRTGDRRVPGKR